MPSTRPTRLAGLLLIAAGMAAAMPGPAIAQADKAPPPIEPRTMEIDAGRRAGPGAQVPALPQLGRAQSRRRRADLSAHPLPRLERRQSAKDDRRPLGRDHREIRTVAEGSASTSFPTAEVRKYIDGWNRHLEQIAFGARRQTCDWNYTIAEQRQDVINVALPDGQGMRQWIRLVSLKARLEIAEGKYDQAIRTIETGMAFSRHIAGGPFLINGLIGMAGVHVMIERCEELVTRPGAPNLYWALAALPSPVIDLRHEIEIERRLFENLIPELEQVESGQPRTAAEWSSLLARIHASLVKLSRDYNEPELKTFSAWDLARD